jgi:outer membrane protein assembly factor BamB
MAPAIGRNFVYIPQNGGAGVLVVDKGTGSALYNFAANGVGAVSQPVTITCDNYLFAGDRDGNWWLLNVNDQVAEFSSLQWYCERYRNCQRWNRRLCGRQYPFGQRRGWRRLCGRV